MQPKHDANSDLNWCEAILCLGFKIDVDIFVDPPDCFPKSV